MPPRRTPKIVVTGAAAAAALAAGAYAISTSGSESSTSAVAQSSSTSAAASPSDALGGTEPAPSTTADQAAGGPVPTTARTTVPTTTAAAVAPARESNYAIERATVAVSPAVAKVRSRVEFELHKFPRSVRVTVAVLDSNRRAVITLTATTNRDGAAAGSFTAPARGTYTVLATVNGSDVSASSRLTTT